MILFWTISEISIRKGEMLPLKFTSWAFRDVTEKGKERVNENLRILSRRR